MPPDYLGVRMDEHVMHKGRVRRAAPLVGLAGRTAGEAVVASLGRRVRGQRGSTAEFHERTAQRYAERLGRSKGVLMKAGQILSFTSIAPMLGEENATIWQSALARLQDDAPPMPAELAVEVVTRELGQPPEKAFKTFDPVPMAAASIGQVHAATTADGEDVVVKVQYPGVDEAIRADLRNTELLVTFFELMRGVLPDMNRIDARAAAAEVTARIGEEIDYVVEARNQQAFADAYRGHPAIRIPDVMPELSTSRVLTMTRADGLRYADAVHASQELHDAWGEVIQRFALGSIRRFGMFHADPHPGNYLFHDDGTVTFLDFGCVKSFTRAQVLRIKRLLNVVVAGDADAAMEAFFDIGIFDPAAPPDRGAALRWYRNSLEPLVAPQPYTYTPEFAARVVRDEMSPLGPFGEVVRSAAIDPAYVMLTRINLGVTSVLGGLRSTGPWEAMRKEWDAGGRPATPLGVAEADFLASRGIAQ
ncbi:AarF/ABC1/UbiB kinase family protein [Skermania sp. ID1734]|uniref:ABC1 kinase family protein n=1 Tax=Skermania sp. ID1734 TaxID=2597516 RepID=UPI00117EF409|nr:AarF/ABC1/UbiB kinase family protein [Skermania sp. ID1734]TSE01633.1 AarF/ABC1/UbiB kinase family protein [Skermania sp. ID1734]